jgi:hypothetical protein
VVSAERLRRDLQSVAVAADAGDHNTNFGLLRYLSTAALKARIAAVDHSEAY